MPGPLGYLAKFCKDWFEKPPLEQVLIQAHKAWVSSKKH